MQGVGNEPAEVHGPVGVDIAAQSVAALFAGQGGRIEREGQLDALGIRVGRDRKTLQHKQSAAVDGMLLIAHDAARRGLVSEREIRGENLPDRTGETRVRVHLGDVLEFGLRPGARLVARADQDRCGKGHLVRNRPPSALRVLTGGGPRSGRLGQQRRHKPGLSQLHHRSGPQQMPHPVPVVVGHPDHRPQVSHPRLDVVDRTGHRGAPHRQSTDPVQRRRGELQLAQQLGAYAQQVSRLAVGSGLLPEEFDGLGVIICPPGESGRQPVGPPLVDLKVLAVEPVDDLFGDVHRRLTNPAGAGVRGAASRHSAVAPGYRRRPPGFRHAGAGCGSVR